MCTNHACYAGLRRHTFRLLRPRAIPRIEHGETFNILEIFSVTCGKWQTMRQRDSCNLGIFGGNRSPLTRPRSNEQGVFGSASLIEWKIAPGKISARVIALIKNEAACYCPNQSSTSMAGLGRISSDSTLVPGRHAARAQVFGSLGKHATRRCGIGKSLAFNPVKRW